ncbi:MAG: EamA family transporter RarD [Herpetosiphonaceae bacterium]|nr:EamA family transporter RarD [Herpetosiphonaceae bacterium]
MKKGVVYAGSCYIAWGLLPFFWKALHNVPALEIVAHRIVWSLLVVLGLLAYRHQWHWLGAALRNRRIMLTYATSACMLTVNWLVYIWAVNAGYVVETSLGYFINPLVSVLLGVLFLRERLRLGQVLALAVACCGVGYLTLSYGRIPWIALTIAGSFGIYGLLRKTAALESLEGLTLETLLLFLPALVYLVYLTWVGHAALGHGPVLTNALLVLAGVVTAIPLLLFAAGARLISMTTLGILQFVNPTLQFFLGVFVYHEALSSSQLVGFAFIWVALVLYLIEGRFAGRRIGSRPRTHEAVPIK